MKKFLLFLLVPLLWNCSDDDNDNSGPSDLAAETLLNVSYGSDPEQIMDVYLPAGRTDSRTKVLILVHGGGWTGGSKNDFTPIIPAVQITYPDYAVVNIDYRLATSGSPGFPKQINDIEAVIAHLEASDYEIDDRYAFIGTSAGGHLSMLYGYNYDPQRKVKAIVNIVGPTDFTDPAYTENDLFDQALVNLVGEGASQETILAANPISHVSPQSPPTLQFMGNEDILIPVTQGQRLKAALDADNIDNELNIYNAGHGNFSAEDTQDIDIRTQAFFSTHF